MKKMIFLFLMIGSAALQAQDVIELLLQEVERNNTTLSALRSQVEAEKTGNRTGIYLHNPEVDLYLLSKSDEPLRRTNLHVLQPFDFATLLGRRSKLSRELNKQLDYHYLEARQNILFEARQLIVDMIFCNAMDREYERRLTHARNIARAYESMLGQGEVNILEHNKAQINLFNLQKASELNDIERRALLAGLQALNGGQPLEISLAEFPSAVLPTDFSAWYEQESAGSPALLSAGQEVAVSRQQERLARAEWLPGFSAGFMMEAMPHERFSGFGMGISIPLWENRNTLRYARLKTMATQEQQADLQLRFLGHYRGLHQQALALQETSQNYRRMLQGLDNTDLLQKALEAGQISLIEYLLELGFYYEAVNMSLETQRQLHRTMAELERLAP